MRGRGRRDVNKIEKILRQRTEGVERSERGEREREEEGEALGERVHTGRLLGTLSEWKH